MIGVRPTVGKTQVFVASGIGTTHFLRAFGAKSGLLIWQYTMNDYAEYSPISAGSIVIVANRAGQLVAVDAKTGKLAWQTDLNGTPFSQPSLWRSEKLSS